MINQPLEVRLRKWVRERQTTSNLLTLREVSRRYRISLAQVNEMVDDMGLNVNVGLMAGGGTCRALAGDYTLEDLSA